MQKGIAGHVIFPLKINPKLVSALLFLSLIFFICRPVYGQEARYTFSFRSETLENVFLRIQDETTFTFFYNSEDVDDQQRVSLEINEATLQDLLDLLVAELSLEFNISGNVISVKPADTPGRKNFTISGRVLDETTGESLIGVNVIVKGTTLGSITDYDGNFSLNIPDESVFLQFSYIGYETKEITVGNRIDFNITLVPAIEELEEVLVIGYGTTLKRNFAGVTSEISTEDLEVQPIATSEMALQGLASGVQVTSSGGTPGSGVRVLVRGQRSINSSNEPLYIVDGVPVNSSSIGQRGLGGETQNLLSGLNPNDIESITVLKDASSTAIYGARAANGVVLITTKQGSKSDKTTFEVNLLSGIGKEVARYEWLNSDEYVEIVNEARRNSGIPEVDYGDYYNTDWLDHLLQTANMTEIQASARGGNEKTQYYVSGGYRTEDGIIIESGYQRGSFRANLNHQPSKNLKFGTNLTLSRDLNRRQLNNWHGSSPYGGAITSPPVHPVYNDDGSYYYIDGIGNAVASAKEVRFHNTTSKFTGNFSFDWSILEHLTFRTVLSYDLNYLREDHFESSLSPSAMRSVDPPELGNKGYFGYYELSRYNIEPTLSYSRNLKERHQIDLLAGSTIQGNTFYWGRTSGQGLGSSNKTTYVISASITEGLSTRTDYNFLSYFGRIGYALDGKYVANFTIRADGSSRFGPDRRFGTFYAGSVAWNFSDESFLSDLDWLSFGKLRAGYGITGNDQIGDYAYMASWTNAGAYLGFPGLAPTQISNPALSWEQTGTFDAGIELGFFRDRMSGSLGYFNSETTDLLFGIPLTGRSGFESVTGNLGDVRNSGIEFDISGVLISKPDITWRASLNFSWLHNEIVSLTTDKPIVQTLIPNAMIVGQPINTYYTLKYEGVNVANGSAIFFDADRNGKININDKTVVGNAHPDYFGGINTTLSYKSISLTAMVNFMAGYQLYNLSYWLAEGYDARSNKPRYVLDRWQNPGDKTDVPKLSYSTSQESGTQISSRYMSDGDFIRLKNLTLAYDLPARVAVKMKLQGLRVYITGTNLLTFTKYEGLDPEMNTFNQQGGEINPNTWYGIDANTIPQLKYIMIGTNIKF